MGVQNAKSVLSTLGGLSLMDLVAAGHTRCTNNARNPTVSKLAKANMNGVMVFADMTHHHSKWVSVERAASNA